MTAPSPFAKPAASRRSYLTAARDGFNSVRASDRGKFWPANRRTRSPGSFAPAMPTSPALARTPRGASIATRPKAQFQRDFNAATGALRRGWWEKGRGAGDPAQTVRGDAHRPRRARPTAADRALGRPRGPREAKSRARDRGLGRARVGEGMARPVQAAAAAARRGPRYKRARCRNVETSRVVRRAFDQIFKFRI
jgi:hypothetical protein